jgi:hypothetical protein
MKRQSRSKNQRKPEVPTTYQPSVHRAVGVGIRGLAWGISIFLGAIVLALIPGQLNELLAIVVPHVNAHGVTPATIVGLGAIGLYSLLGIAMLLIVERLLLGTHRKVKRADQNA